MADGELAAVVEGLAKDAVQTGRSIVRKAAATVRDTAVRAETSSAEHLANDAKAAERLTKSHPGVPTLEELAAQPKQLGPGRTDISLAKLRRTPGGPARGKVGEGFSRLKYGGEPETHYPVALNPDGEFPVTTPGGRKTDVPVKLPNGTTMGVEVKFYLNWRSVKLPDGTSTPVKGEVPLSSHIREQINKDVALREADPTYDPRWEFLGAGPSDELREYLTKARIIFLEYD